MVRARWESPRPKTEYCRSVRSATVATLLDSQSPSVALSSSKRFRGIVAHRWEDGQLWEELLPSLGLGRTVVSRQQVFELDNRSLGGNEWPVLDEGEYPCQQWLLPLRLAAKHILGSRLEPHLDAVLPMRCISRPVDYLRVVWAPVRHLGHQCAEGGDVQVGDSRSRWRCRNGIEVAQV